MFCDLCSKNEATVHLTEIINEETRELHLCETCARKKGAAAAGQFGLAELLAGLSDWAAKPGAKTPPPSCGECGFTYEDFRKSGRLGCGHCYESFQKVLAPLLKRIHGSGRYIGRLAPSALGKAAAAAGKEAPAQDDLARLKERMKEAVASEDFEEAARLRDRIRTLDKKKKGAG